MSGVIQEFPRGVYPRNVVLLRGEPIRKLSLSVMSPPLSGPVNRAISEPMRHSPKGSRPRALQKNSAVKRHQNLADRDNYIRLEFAKKCADDPSYSVERFRNWLKKTRKFKNLWHQGKLISVQRLSEIIDQVDPPKNT